MHISMMSMFAQININKLTNTGLAVKREIMIEEQRKNLKMWEECYKTHRTYLISHTLSMTGNLMDAEDIVQETVSACLKINFNRIVNHRAWMARICSNRSIDLFRLKQKNHIYYENPWTLNTIQHALSFECNLQIVDHDRELSENINKSFLILLQKLNPTQRVVFVLKEVLGYSYKSISMLLDKSLNAIRKIIYLARKSLKSKTFKFSKPSEEAKQLFRYFFEVAKTRNQNLLEELLSEHSELLCLNNIKVAAA